MQTCSTFVLMPLLMRLPIPVVAASVSGACILQHRTRAQVLHTVFTIYEVIRAAAPARSNFTLSLSLTLSYDTHNCTLLPTTVHSTALTRQSAVSKRIQRV
eukprot:191-Heterococcus_DN1.PRE.1